MESVKVEAPFLLGAVWLNVFLKTKFPNLSNNVPVNHEFVQNIINRVESIEVASADSKDLQLI